MFSFNMAFYGVVVGRWFPSYSSINVFGNCIMYWEADNSAVKNDFLQYSQQFATFADFSIRSYLCGDIPESHCKLEVLGTFPMRV